MVRKVWRIDKAGSLNRLRFEEEKLPSFQKGEVCIQVQAIGLNFADIFACLGLYSATPKGAFIPGLEFAGIVKKIGISESNAFSSPYKEGDAVFGVIRFGAYTNYLNVDSQYITPLPKGWSFAQGAAFPVQGLTARYGLKELGNLQPDHLVLLHSAAGGVGLFALEMIQKTGAQVIATVGNEEKSEFLQKYAGLDEKQIIVRHSKSFQEQLQNALKTLDAKGFDLIFDAVYGKYFQPAYELLQPGGRYLLYGAAEMMSHGSRPNYFQLAIQYLKRAKPDPLAMISENRSLMAFNLIWLWDHLEQMKNIQSNLLETIEPPLMWDISTLLNRPRKQCVFSKQVNRKEKLFSM